MKRSLFRDYLLIALPAKSGLFVGAAGIYADEPLLLAAGLVVLLVVLAAASAPWISNRRASRTDTDGDVDVFRYPVFLTVGGPAATWFTALFWAVLFLVPGEDLMVWVLRLIGIVLIAVSSVGAYHVTRSCRNDLGEIRLSALGIESRMQGGHPRFIPWSEVVAFSAASCHGVVGHGVQVVGVHDTLSVYEKIRGIRVLKKRLLFLAKEYDIPDAAVCWDRLGLITEADRDGLRGRAWPGL